MLLELHNNLQSNIFSVFECFCLYELIDYVDTLDLKF